MEYIDTIRPDYFYNSYFQDTFWQELQIATGGSYLRYFTISTFDISHCSLDDCPMPIIHVLAMK